MDYFEARRTVAAAECPHCHGSGKIDDADLGDIYFRTFTCPDCKGSGWKPGKELALTPTTPRNP